MTDIERIRQQRNNPLSSFASDDNLDNTLIIHYSGFPETPHAKINVLPQRIKYSILLPKKKTFSPGHLQMTTWK